MATNEGDQLLDLLKRIDHVASISHAAGGGYFINYDLLQELRAVIGRLEENAAPCVKVTETIGATYIDPWEDMHIIEESAFGIIPWHTTIPREAFPDPPSLNSHGPRGHFRITVEFTPKEPT